MGRYVAVDRPIPCILPETMLCKDQLGGPFAPWLAILSLVHARLSCASSGLLPRPLPLESSPDYVSARDIRERESDGSWTYG